MSNEITVSKKVIDYLKHLGFSKTKIKLQVQIEKGRIADAIIIDKNDNAIVVVEWKNENINLPKENDKTLRFNPVVRQLQILADKVKAPYYLISNGTVFSWFKTDNKGLPLLINEPLNYKQLLDISEEEQVTEKLTNIFEELKRFLFWKGGTTRSEEAAFVIFSKLRSDSGDTSLKSLLLEDQINHLSLFDSQQPVDQQFSEYFSELIKHNSSDNHLAEAFHILDRVNLRSLDSRLIIKAIDSAFLNTSITKGNSKIYRWLADFMVRLADPKNGEIILDIASNTGEILAATKMYSEYCSVYGITDQKLSALWGQIQQEILRNSKLSISISSGIPKELQKSKIFPIPDYIITAPFHQKKRSEKEYWSHLYQTGISNTEDLLAELALAWVKPEGRVVMLVPDSLLNSVGKRSITRQMLLYNARLVSIISLPAGSTFQSSNYKCSILVFDKISKAVDYKIFFAAIENSISEDHFDCRSIPEVNEILQEFTRFERDSPNENSLNTYIVQSDNLDSNSLTFRNDSVKSVLSKDNSKYPILELTEISENIRRGKSIKLRSDGDIPVIGPAVIRPMSLNLKSVKKTSSLDLPSNAPIIEVGDVLINLIGTHIGDATIANKSVSGYFISGHVGIIKTNRSIIFPEYLAIVLNGEFVKKQISYLSTGVVFAGLSLNKLLQITIPVPPLQTQKQIIDSVTELQNKIDQTKENLFSLEEQLTELLRSGELEDEF